MSGTAKAAVAFAVVLIGLDLYGRWTGTSWHANLLGPNGIGTAIKNARSAG